MKPRLVSDRLQAQTIVLRPRNRLATLRRGAAFRSLQRAAAAARIREQSVKTPKPDSPGSGTPAGKPRGPTGSKAGRPAEAQERPPVPPAQATPPPRPELITRVFAWLDTAYDDLFQQYMVEKEAARRRFDEHFPTLPPAGLRPVLVAMDHLAQTRAAFQLVRLRNAWRSLVVERAEELHLPAGAAGQLPAADAELGAWLDRVCELLEAVDHWAIHALSHEIPKVFVPNPIRRELAFAGVGQRILAHFTAAEQAVIQLHQRVLAARFKDAPEWSVVAEVAAETANRVWRHPAVDQVVITCWPLVKRHNWTYSDLMAVARQIIAAVAARRPELRGISRERPLHDANALATHCRNALGLKKDRRDRTSPTGQPKGMGVARALFASSLSGNP